MENIKNILTPCPIHYERKMLCKECNKEICQKCIITNKEEISHYKNHFKSIYDPQLSENDSIKIHEYEGFELLNKTYKAYIVKIDNLIFSSNEKILVSKEIIIKSMKDLLLSMYSKYTNEFESSVKLVNSKISNLDINDQNAKEEFKKLKKSLDDLTEFLDNEEKLNLEFQKIIDRVTKKFERMKIADFIQEKFKFNLGKNGECLDLIGCNGSIVETVSGRGGSYWSVRSEESFNGEFKAKVKVLKIDSVKANNNFGYAIGICRKNSTVIDAYYNDSIVLQANGYLANKFSGSGTYKKLFKTNWVANDEIIIKRDSKNNLYFGINSESDMQLGFENISGEFKIIIGFTSSSVGDSFELLELE